MQPAGFLIRSASMARRACSIIASGVAASITGAPGDGASRFFLTSPLYQLGSAFEIHDVPRVKPARAAWTLLPSFHVNILRVMLHRCVDGMGAHRTINFRSACWGWRRIRHLSMCHVSILLHTIRRTEEEKSFGFFPAVSDLPAFRAATTGSDLAPHTTKIHFLASR